MKGVAKVIISLGLRSEIEFYNHKIGSIKMESYREYPIRCKSCGEQIACYAPDFEQAIEEGFTPEEALNQLGITDYCSRIAMLNPVIVAFNMENRQVIEGFKSIDAAQEEDIQSGYASQPIFSACMTPESDIPHWPHRRVPPQHWKRQWRRRSMNRVHGLRP
jgi:DNA-directed RNA polymerase subunit N (RpoN/RPB10)